MASAVPSHSRVALETRSTDVAVPVRASIVSCAFGAPLGTASRNPNTAAVARNTNHGIAAETRFGRGTEMPEIDGAPQRTGVKVER